MTPIKTLMMTGSIVLLTACVSPGNSRDAAGADSNVPTKTARPDGNKPRQEDCIGENQSSKGITRPDCLPNDADAAARETEAGSGRSVLHP